MFSGKLHLISSGLGVLTHLAVFIKGEWDVYAPHLACYFLFYPVVSFCLLAILGYGHVARAAALALLSYDSGIWLSMIVYRWFYHPLRHFPGPASARISALWSLRRVAKDAKWQINVQELHKQYGNFVRISGCPLAYWMLYKADIFSRAQRNFYQRCGRNQRNLWRGYELHQRGVL